MLDQEDRHAVADQPAQMTRDFPRQRRIDPGHGLVEQDQLGPDISARPISSSFF
jgi:hypothetical protein